MKLLKYIKRLIKYVLYEKKQPIVYANVIEQSKNKIHLNKRYVVTGGGSGLGYYIAKSLIKSGAFVVITGRKEDKLIESQKKLGKNCIYRVMDITNIKKSKEVLEELFDKYEIIDGIINNAGISLHEGNILNVSEENFDMQFNTNLKGAYFFSQNYIIQCKKHKQDSGNIIFISSERGSMCDDIPYGLTKVAINSLTKGLSRRFYRDGIRVNAVAPGVTCSDMTNYDKNGDLFLDNTAGRVLLPEEIAEIVNFALSDYSKCISGEVINCDAGKHIASFF